MQFSLAFSRQKIVSNPVLSTRKVFGSYFPLILIGFLLMSEAQASSLVLAAHENVKIKANVGCSGGAFCQLKRKVSGSWVLIQSISNGSSVYIYDFGLGLHEFNLETYSYTSQGMGVIENDLASITIQNTPPPPPQYGGTFTYTYDDLGRLESSLSLGGANYHSVYEYDAADNRVKKEVVAGLPSSSISIESMIVKNISYAGTASYQLASDGYVKINQGGSTVTLGRWLASHLSANNFEVRAILTNGTGGSPCTSGYMSSWFPAHYSPSWTKTAPGGTGVHARCTFLLEVRETSKPLFILGSASITLSAGPGAAGGF